MNDAGAEGLLKLLQFGDGFFPSGATAFSWGLETLRADGAVRGAAQVADLLDAWITLRWAPCERPLMQAARRAAEAGDDDALRGIDRLCDAMAVPAEAREAGRRLGGALLRTHAAMDLSAAAAWLERVRRGETPGQLAAVQGLVAAAHGLPPAAADALSAYGLASAISGAALRMGLVGHVDAQRLLAALRPRIAALSALPVPAPEDAWNGAPAIDLAMIRHETGQARLFAN